MMSCARETVPYKIAVYIQHIYSILAVYLCSIPAVQLQHCCNHASTFLPFNFNAGSMNAVCFKYVNYAASMLQICKLCSNAVYAPMQYMLLCSICSNAVYAPMKYMLLCSICFNEVYASMQYMLLCSICFINAAIQHTNHLICKLKIYYSIDILFIKRNNNFKCVLYVNF